MVADEGICRIPQEKACYPKELRVAVVSMEGKVLHPVAILVQDS